MACCIHPNVRCDGHSLVFNMVKVQGSPSVDWHQARFIDLKHAFTLVNLLLLVLDTSVNMDAQTWRCLAKGSAHSIHLAPHAKQLGHVTACKVCKEWAKFQAKGCMAMAAIKHFDICIFHKAAFPFHVKSW